MKRIWVGVLVWAIAIALIMKDLEYKNKTIRMDERTWIKLKDKRKRSGLSWNRFLLKLLDNKKL